MSRTHEVCWAAGFFDGEGYITIQERGHKDYVGFYLRIGVNHVAIEPLLELQRLFKELQFVESDYLYQSEIIKQTDKIFLESVDSILEKYPDLKTLWLERTQKKQNDISQVLIEDVVEAIEIENKPNNSNLKQIYREIVKSTHPDKVKNLKLNELYIEATQAYESNDIVTLYKVCSELLIDFEFDQDEINKIEERIENYKNQIVFLESTYTFKWLKSDESEKDKIILNFIKNRLNNI